MGGVMLSSRGAVFGPRLLTDHGIRDTLNGGLGFLICLDLLLQLTYLFFT